jgi:hypothetical protein
MFNVSDKYALDVKRRSTQQEFLKSIIDEIVSLNVHNVIYSMNNGYQFQFSFASNFWHIDFDMFVQEEPLQKMLHKKIFDKITSCVDLLQQAEVHILISNAEPKFELNKYPIVKCQLDIQVNGIVKTTGEKYHFHTSLFLSPIE